MILLRYPEVIPSASWLRNNLLWSDQLAAFWPALEEPTPDSAEQEQTLRELRELRAAKAFTVFTANVGPERVEKLLDDLPAEVLCGAPSPWSQQHAALLGDVVGGAGLPGGASDPARFEHGGLSLQQEKAFVYASKLNYASVDVLYRRGLAFAAPDDADRGPGFHTRPAVINTLLQVAAEDLARRKRQLILPVPSQPDAARALMEPRPDKRTTLATLLSLPALPAIDPSRSLMELLDLRNSPGFVQGRQDYLHGLRGLLTTLREDAVFIGREPTMNYLGELALGRLAGDLRGAQDSLVSRLTSQDVLVAAGSVAMNVISAAHAAPDGDVGQLAASTTLHALVEGVNISSHFRRRRGAPSFLSQYATAIKPAPRN